MPYLYNCIMRLYNKSILVLRIKKSLKYVIICILLTHVFYGNYSYTFLW